MTDIWRNKLIMKLILIGIPGSGKSTQGNLLSKKFNIPYLSTGHIFRELAKEHTKLGHQIKVIMTAGLLISDKKTLDIVSEYLSRPAYKNGYILDGFPRTITQAKDFANGIDKVIYLYVPDKEILWRLAYRDEEREDDTLKAIIKRIELFHKFTEPVLDYYKEHKKLVKIDGERSIEEVYKEIVEKLDVKK
jgi:adenylate kinase